jgi:uncharacterized protein (TIGR03437 family)
MKAAIQIPVLISLFAGSVHAAAPVFAALLGGSGQDFALSVTSDAQGNTYVAGLTYSPDFPVTTGAAQTKFGGTCDAFVAKLGPDGKRIWSTYLGGILDDWATGVALDSAGNVLVSGYTRSPNFPLVNPIQSVYNNGVSDDFDGFVAKFDPNGSKLLYSTFLGGTGIDGADGIAVDAAGNAYVAVSAQSAVGFPGVQNGPNQFGIVVSKLNPQGGLIYSFYHQNGSSGAIALDAAGNVYVAGTAYPYNPSTPTQTFGTPGTAEALVFKLSPDGTKKIFETTLGGSVQANASAIAVNRAGEVYVAGTTSSVDFPLVHPLQSSPGARPIWKSTDGGVTWTPMDDLPFALPRAMVVDPGNPNTIYEATGDLGVFKSLDGGATWSKANSGIASTNIQTLVIDPVHPQTLYAATTSVTSAADIGVYKTVNGGNSWTLVDSPPSPISQLQLAVDPQNPNIVWENSGPLRKTTDGGATWNSVTFPGSVALFALDPHVSGTILAISNMVFCGIFCGNNQPQKLYRSTDGGATWTQENLPLADHLVADGSTTPTTFYDGLHSKSVDGGVTWTPVAAPPGSNTTGGILAVDPSGTLYSVSVSGIFVSRDHAQTWTAAGSLIPPPTGEAGGPPVTALIPAGTSGTLYAPIYQVAASGFVSKLSADGSSLLYSTYLRGHASLEAFLIFLAEPSPFQTQTWINGIAVDAAGNMTVAGGTRATDFPTVMPAQAANAGLADAFATTISADGSQLNYSTYFGGSQDDGAFAVALDPQGNVIIAGQTWSGDYPIPGGVQPPTGYGEAFVVKLGAPGPPVITAVVNGASFQPGIEAGSWVTIQGSNLANTFPGRKWRTDEVVNGNLPTSLDGVSVTIDGKPAFVYYISPTQINVQAPSDSATGPVSVVVTNNGSISAPATAQLQAAAPAFFLYPGTNEAIASRLPDFTPIGDPSAVAGTVAAAPGDLLVLWGTGFGATNPTVSAGTTVGGAPIVVTPPTVTVGGVTAQVISAVLTTGTAGLYQVTIQLPATVPAGAVVVQASAGGLQASGMLFVAKP